MTKLEYLICCLIWIALLFILFSNVLDARGSDYIITNYGQGIFSIEHDGVIHIQGKGAPGKTDGDNNENSDWPISIRSSNNSEPETKYEQDLEAAQQFEAKGWWIDAASKYKKIGDTEKAKQMAYKDIVIELAKNPPNYTGASWTAAFIIENKDLAMEYYEKGLDQQLAKEGNQN